MHKILRSDYQPFSIETENHHNEKKLISFFDYLEWIGQKSHELFIKFLPLEDIRAYPPLCMYFAGTLLYLFIICMFGSLFGFLFYTNASNIYLAPVVSSDHGPDITDASCTAILSSNTGVYHATKNGIWEGQNGFTYAEAVYMITLSSAKYSQSFYETILANLYIILENLGQASLQYDLGTNLLFWFSFIEFADNANLANRFNLIGIPSFALNRQNIYGTISSVAGECQLLNQYATFDQANSLLILNIPYNEYISNSICLAAGDPFYLGYNQRSTSNNFQIKVDVNSLITALSINLGIIRLDSLTEIVAFRNRYSYNNNTIQFEGSQYFNPKFPGMAPIPCIVNVYCFLRIGPSNFVIPFFHHVGNSTIVPDKCNCTIMSDGQKDDPLNICNSFAFLAGFMYYPTDNILALAEFIYHANKTSFGSVHEDIFEPAFVASAFGQNSPYYPVFNQTVNRENLYKFCETAAANCSFVTFSLFDSNNPDWSISSYYYQLTNGACQDQFTSTKEDWQKLVENPYSSLTQDYQECSDNEVFVFFTQLGSALGALDLIVPTAVLITLIVIALYQLYRPDGIPETYPKEERESAINALAVSLLLFRDQHRNDVLEATPSEEESVKLNQESMELLKKIVHALDLHSTYHANQYELKKKLKELHSKRPLLHINRMKIGRKSSRVDPEVAELLEHNNTKVHPDK